MMIKDPLQGLFTLLVTGLTVASFVGLGQADDQPQWGQRHTRNMVSPETHLPETFDPRSGVNVKWSVPLGSNAYSSPVVAGGRLLIGTNNDLPRDPRHHGDRGVILCLNEADGGLRWQLVVPRTPGNDIYKDWPQMAICSPPTVEGNRAYTLTNQFELVCLDLQGQANGNTGPFRGEGSHMTPVGEPPLEVGPIDADIVWLLDLPDDVGTYPHDSAHSSILLDGPLLYLNTCNGVDKSHITIPRHQAPSLIAVDKTTGRLVARDDEGIGPRIFHSTWSSPAMGSVADRKLVFFGGGDGVCYAFDAVRPQSIARPTQKLHRVWHFDCDPQAPKENVHQYHRKSRGGPSQASWRDSPSNIMSMPVFHKNRLYVTVGGDIWWGKQRAWLKCVDATQTGNVTQSAELWSYPLQGHSCSTPSIVDGMVFVADYNGNLYCLDADTGKCHWTHELDGRVFASTLVADGKVYIGTMRNNFWVLAAAREKRVLHALRFDAPIAATAVAANEVLYVNTLERLFALQQGARSYVADTTAPSK